MHNKRDILHAIITLRQLLVVAGEYLVSPFTTSEMPILNSTLRNFKLSWAYFDFEILSRSCLLVNRHSLNTALNSSVYFATTQLLWNISTL